eukprot:TRINITY_DN18833_c0_g1_i1.p1 TRINITY_DN18833_c0_g1~~TRINITY_DN18833_c0_g1_i1.p1  ORF type:complete len:934 (+),score=106.86 TRINITY_DN18833_c0_g1_i1:59-2860(+)
MVVSIDHQSLDPPSPSGIVVRCLATNSLLDGFIDAGHGIEVMSPGIGRPLCCDAGLISPTPFKYVPKMSPAPRSFDVDRYTSPRRIIPTISTPQTLPPASPKRVLVSPRRHGLTSPRNKSTAERKLQAIQQKAVSVLLLGIHGKLLMRYFTKLKIFFDESPDFFEGDLDYEPSPRSMRRHLPSLIPTLPLSLCIVGTQTHGSYIGRESAPETPRSPQSSTNSFPPVVVTKSPRMRLRNILLRESCNFICGFAGCVVSVAVYTSVEAYNINTQWYYRPRMGGDLVNDLQIEIPEPSEQAGPVLRRSMERSALLSSTSDTFVPDLTAVAHSLRSGRYGTLTPSAISGEYDETLPASAPASAPLTPRSEAGPDLVSPIKKDMKSRSPRTQKMLPVKLRPNEEPLEYHSEDRFKQTTDSSDHDSLGNPPVAGLSRSSSTHLHPTQGESGPSKAIPARGVRRQKTLPQVDHPVGDEMGQGSMLDSPSNVSDRFSHSDPAIMESIARSDLSIAGAVATTEAVKKLVMSIKRDEETKKLNASESQISSFINLNESTESDKLAKSAPGPGCLQNMMEPARTPRASTPMAGPSRHLPSRPRRHSSKKLGDQSHPPDEQLDRHGILSNDFFDKNQFPSAEMVESIASGGGGGGGKPTGAPDIFTPHQSVHSAASILPYETQPQPFEKENQREDEARRTVAIGAVPKLSVGTQRGIGLVPPTVKPDTLQEKYELTMGDGLELDPLDKGGPPPPPRMLVSVASPRNFYNTPRRKPHSEMKTVMLESRSMPSEIVVRSPPKICSRDMATVVQKRMVTRVAPYECDKISPRRMRELSPLSDVEDGFGAPARCNVPLPPPSPRTSSREHDLEEEINRLRAENLSLKTTLEAPLITTLAPDTVVQPTHDIDRHKSPQRERPALVIPVMNPKDFKNVRAAPGYPPFGTMW